MKVQLLGEQDACCGSPRPLPYSSAPQFSDASVNASIGVALTCTRVYRIHKHQMPEKPNESSTPKSALCKMEK